MRILLVRHGESEGNVNPSVYINKGDSKIGLTQTGWRQAVGAGKFLDGYYRETATAKWPVVFLSSYQRPKETFSGILHGMNDTFAGDPKLYEDPRLVEKFFGAASALAHADPADTELYEAIRVLSKRVYQNDSFTAKHLFGDSTKDILVAVKGFIDGTLRRDILEGKDDFLFVVHGAVIQAFIMSWAHVQMVDKNKIGNPGNCDVIAITGQSKDWKITKLYDGEKFERANRDMMKGIIPFGFRDLPAVPDFLKNDI